MNYAGRQIGELSERRCGELLRISLLRGWVNNGAASYHPTYYCYLMNVGITKEDRRSLAIEAMLADARDKRIAWANRALDMGVSPSPNLFTLALLSVERTPSPWEVADLFRHTLEDLDLGGVRREEGLRQCARDVAENIASGVVDPVVGARQLRELAQALGYPEDMRPWDDHFFEDSFLIDFKEGELIYSDEMPLALKREAWALLHRIPKKYF